MKSVAIVDNNFEHVKKMQSGIIELQDTFLNTLAYSGQAFIEFCFHTKKLPDIALVCFELPDFDGVAITDFITAYFPSIKVIAVSTYSHQEAVEDMFICGAWGYVYKSFVTNSDSLMKFTNMQHEYENLQNAINLVSWNRQFVDPILKMMHPNKYDTLDRERLVAKRSREKEANQVFGLSYDEQIIAYLSSATNLSKTEIAEILSVSEKKVEMHLTAVFRKLGVNGRLALTRTCLTKYIVRNARGILGK